MKKIQGKPIFGGIAIGKIHYFSKEQKEITHDTVADVEAEVARFEAAKATALEQLHELYEKALVEVI